MKYVVKLFGPTGESVVFIDTKGMNAGLGKDYPPIPPLAISKIYEKTKFGSAKERQQWSKEKSDKEGSIEVHPKEWFQIADPVNRFFETLTPEDKFCIYRRFQTMLTIIVTSVDTSKILTISDLITAAKEVGREVTALDKDINLVTKIRNWVPNNVNIGDYSNAGKSAQDREASTYYEHDGIEITCMSMLMKILFPIFGMWIKPFHITKKNVADDDLIMRSPGALKIGDKKEIFCSVIVDDILREKFPNGDRKLTEFITHFMKKIYDEYRSIENMKNDKGQEKFATQAFDGVTDDTVFDCSRSNALIKILVNSDITTVSDKTIMAYVGKSIKDGIHNKAEKPKIRITKRIDMSESKNTPQADIDAICSQTSVEVTGLIAVEIPRIVERVRSALDVSKEEYNLYLSHYAISPLNRTIYNQYILCGMFGRVLNGGTGLTHLSHEEYVHLILCAQLYCIENKMYEVLKMLSATKSGVSNTIASVSDNPNGTYTSLTSYQECKGKFTLMEKKFREVLSAVFTETWQNEYIHNLPDPMWEKIEQANINDTGIQKNRLLTIETLRILDVGDTYEGINP